MNCKYRPVANILAPKDSPEISHISRVALLPLLGRLPQEPDDLRQLVAVARHCRAGVVAPADLIGDRRRGSPFDAPARDEGRQRGRPEAALAALEGQAGDLGVVVVARGAVGDAEGAEEGVWNSAVDGSPLVATGTKESCRYD